MIGETKNSWKKVCPKCGSSQIYSSWDSLRCAIRRKAVCNSCRAMAKKIIPVDGGWKRVCRMCGDEMIYASRHSFINSDRVNAACKKCAVTESSKHKDKSYFHSNEYKEKMSAALKQKRNTESYGEEFKQKCRENKLKQIEQQGVQRTFNIGACQFMDGISEKFGLKLQHGLNGGEYQFIGYSLDGYDKERNVIFEYDEPKHHIGSVKKKDAERQEKLINHLHPNQFFRYDEKNNKLVEVIENTEVICLRQ